MQIFRYIILPDLELIIDLFKGSFYYHDIIMCKFKQSKDPLWNERYNVLADIRDIELDFSKNDVASHLAESRNTMKFKSSPKTAAITLNPKHVIFGTLVQQNLGKEAAIIFEYFSSIEAAIAWLGCAPSKKEFISDTLNFLNRS